MGDIIGWAYLIGMVWFWRYHVGHLSRFAMSSYQRNPDAADLGFGFFFGTIVNFAWPVTVTGRMAYVLWNKYVPSDAHTNFFNRFFPELKEIEPVGVKKKRMKEAEARALR